MNVEFPMNEYEYKSPSYEQKERKKSFVIHEEQCARESRYVYKDGIYYSKEKEKDEISLLFTGDLLCQEGMLYGYRKQGDDYDFKLGFDYVRPLFCAADFVAGNLETPVSDQAPYRGEILSHEGPFYCNAPVEYLEALKYAGFDMLTTANSHTIDAGAQGIYDTIANIKKFDFIQTGTFVEKTDKFVIVDICGFKIGFTAFSKTYNSMQVNLTVKGRMTLLNTFTEKRAQSVYKAMKEQGAEYTICFPHWGKEFSTEISKNQRKMAETLVNIGYDMIAGAHAHLVQSFEMIEGKPVVFSMGNLMTHLRLSEFQMDTQYPVICSLRLKREGGKILSKVEFIPCRILSYVDGVPYRVVPYDRNLTMPKNIWDRLKEVPKIIQGFLKTGEEVLDLEYPVDEEAVQKLKQMELKHKERIESIARRRNPVRSKKENEARVTEILAQHGFLDEDRKDIIIRKSGVYQKKENEIQMTIVTSESQVLKLEKAIDGIPVTSVANKEQGNDITRILYIGDSVREIKKGAFQKFSRLESVRLFKGLEVIEGQAFMECQRLTGVILPGTLTTIGEKAFMNCTSLMSVKIPPSVTKIGRKAFAGCKKLTIYCEKNSYAYRYAKLRRISVKVMPLSL